MTDPHHQDSCGHINNCGTQKVPEAGDKQGVDAEADRVGHLGAEISFEQLVDLIAFVSDDELRELGDLQQGGHLGEKVHLEG